MPTPKPFERYELRTVASAAVATYVLLAVVPLQWLEHHLNGHAGELLRSDGVFWVTALGFIPFWIAFRWLWMRLLR